MTQPFCCDITSGTKEEQNEFQRLYVLASNKNWGYGAIYYGVDKNGVFDCGNEINYVIHFMSVILPLSEGISILKKMVGEEEKAELNEAIEFGEWLRTFDSLDKKNGFWVLESQVSSKDLYDAYLIDRENWRKLQPKP